MRPLVEINVLEHALSLGRRRGCDPNPYAFFRAVPYFPAVSAIRSFTASPTAANAWDADAFGQVFTNVFAHPFPYQAYKNKR